MRLGMIAGFLPVVLAVALAPDPALGQVDSAPSLVVVPFVSDRGPNLASELWMELRQDIDELGLYDQMKWEAFLDASPRARDMTEEQRGDLSCIHAHQLASEVEVDYVLCGGLQTRRGGMVLELHAIELPSGAVMRLCTEGATDRASVGEEALERFRAWSEDGRPAEVPVPGMPVTSIGCG